MRLQRSEVESIHGKSKLDEVLRYGIVFPLISAS